ncbi:MAG TPA: hypothetical protein VIJ20_11995 [Solirubrobacteraceae bacterium]
MGKASGAEHGSGSSSGSGSALGSATDALQPFADALTAAGKAAAGQSAGDPRVIAAIELGWLIKELTQGWSPDALLGGLVLDEVEKCQVQALQLTTLLATLKLSGLDSASIEQTTGALQSGPAQGPSAKLEPKIVVALLGADARLPKAFVLGSGLRALIPGAATFGSQAVAPSTAPPMNSLIGALDALSSDLPSHAARSVANSLGQWAVSSDASKPGLTLTQVSLWRAVIVGEKKGTELLEPDNYLDAARQLERRFLRRALSSRWLWTIAVLAVALFGVGIYVLLAANGHAGKVAAGASAVLASLGLTWKGIGGTLGKLVGKLEGPLWGAELDAAITDAMTLTEAPIGQPSRAPATIGYADRRGRALRGKPDTDRSSGR